MKYEKGSFVLVPNRKHLRLRSLGARAVYTELCSMCDAYGCCFPSRKLLAENIQMVETSVDRFIEELVESCLLTKTARRNSNGGQTSNLYQIMILPLPTGVDTPSPLVSSPPSPPIVNELYSVLTKPTELFIKDGEEDSPRREKYSERMGYPTTRVKPIRVRGEVIIGNKFPNPIAQDKSISRCLQSGYTEDEIIGCFEGLLEDKFWGEKGVDFTVVVSQIGKGKKGKKNHEAITNKYAKYA